MSFKKASVIAFLKARLTMVNMNEQQMTLPRGCIQVMTKIEARLIANFDNDFGRAVRDGQLHIERHGA